MMRKAIRILKAKFGLISNNHKLLPELPLKAEYESLLTDYHKVEEIKYSDNLDSYIFIYDEPNIKPTLDIFFNRVIATGDFTRLTRETLDLRYSIFGNEGLLFRYTLPILEKNYNIYSFHACAMFDTKNNHMYIICGSAGSGKTCLILRGLELGLALFSTEMTHFSIMDSPIFIPKTGVVPITLYKGSLIDNVRIGNLKYNYPEITNKLNIKIPDTKDEWGKKIAVDLSKFKTKFNRIVNPKITVIFPRVEEGRKKAITLNVTDEEKVTKLIFDNITDKIGETVLLYEKIPMMSLDNSELSVKRVKNVKMFLRKINRAVSIVSGPINCWEGIL